MVTKARICLTCGIVLQVTTIGGTMASCGNVETPASPQADAGTEESEKVV